MRLVDGQLLCWRCQPVNLSKILGHPYTSCCQQSTVCLVYLDRAGSKTRGTGWGCNTLSTQASVVPSQIKYRAASHPNLEQTTRRSPMQTHHSCCVKQCQTASGIQLFPTPTHPTHPTHTCLADLPIQTTQVAIRPQPKSVAHSMAASRPTTGSIRVDAARPKFTASHCAKQALASRTWPSSGIADMNCSADSAC